MHVLNSKQYSGAENVAITIINATRDQVDGVYVSPAGPIKEYLDEAEIKYFPVKKLSYREIKRAIKEVKPDIIHAHDFTAGIMAVLTTLLLGAKIPIINHLHNNSPWIKRCGWRSIVYALSCLRYKKILTVSDSVMDEYVFGSFFRKKTEIIGNPIDIERVRKLAEETPKEAINRYDISFLGRFSPPKNPFLFLDIIAKVKKLKSDVSVIMIGDGELRQEVEQRIKELSLEKNIELVGFQKNPYKFINQAKILLMPSSWEGFGLAAVEALALGKPVICSGAGGLSQIVDERCGAICDKTGDYTKKIRNLLENNEHWQLLSQGAIKRAKKMNNLEKYCSSILQFYAEG